jgi:molecular chaperone GrpE
MSDDGQRDDGAGERDETIVEILGFEGDDPEPAAAPSAPAPGASAAELAAERERYLRLRADFDNFRKRAERERAEVERYALADAARQLLPVVDNLERALAAAGSGAGDELRRGVEMILRQLEDALKRFGVVSVPAQGERFDPSVHEAVSQEESGEVSVPTVVAEFQRGYRLNDRLIRPAMVKVALPAAGGAEAASADREGEAADHRESAGTGGGE